MSRLRGSAAEASSPAQPVTGVRSGERSLRPADIHRDELSALDVGSKSAAAAWLTAAALVIAAAFVMAAVRWWQVANTLDVQVSRRSTLSIYLAALFVGNFLPTTIGGDVLRVNRLTRICGSQANAFATVIIERLTGWVVLPLLTLVGWHRAEPVRHSDANCRRPRWGRCRPASSSGQNTPGPRPPRRHPHPRKTGARAHRLTLRRIPTREPTARRRAGLPIPARRGDGLGRGCYRCESRPASLAGLRADGVDCAESERHRRSRGA